MAAIFDKELCDLRHEVIQKEISEMKAESGKMKEKIDKIYGLAITILVSCMSILATMLVS